jgi:hypothetical protein
MSTIINATTTNGVVIQPDNSGSLELQTNSGTTALTIDTSQRAAFVAGTAAAPAITTTGDTNTGVFFPAADTIAFAEGGAEAMRLDSSGNVNIGATTTDFTSKLGVTSSTSFPLSIITSAVAGAVFQKTTAGAANNIMLLTNNSYNYGVAGAVSANGTASGDIYALGYTPSGSSAMTQVLNWTSTGEVRIAGTTDQGSYNLQCNGTGVWGAGAYVNGSDARIKDNIQPIASSLEVVNKLNPVTFKYKEDWSKDQSVQTGFIAQELQETLKDEIYIDGLVSTGGEYLSVAYQNIIPLLTKAIQEQQQIITDLKATVDAQSVTLNDLKARIETLEAKLG